MAMKYKYASDLKQKPIQLINFTTNYQCKSLIFLQADKQAIIDKHNELRSIVANGEETLGVGGGQPSAANMRKMVWSDDLAVVAQR